MGVREVDFDRVRESISPECPPEHVDRVMIMVWKASQTWLTRDLRKYSRARVSVESNKGGAILAIADLLLYAKGEDRPSLIVDWKTTWRLRKSTLQALSISWQPIFYSWVFDCPRFELRVMDGEGNMKSVLFEPQYTQEQLLAQLGALSVAREGFRKWDIWPQNRTLGSCFAFGAPCEFMEACYSGAPPYGFREREKDYQWSYSAVTTFLRCPERYRRASWVEEHEEVMTEAARIGRAFDRGITEVYKQAYAISE